MRTTVRLDDHLLTLARQLADRTGRTVSQLIEEGLRLVLAQAEHRPERGERFRMVTFRGTGVRQGVDLDDSAALLERMGSADRPDRRS